MNSRQIIFFFACLLNVLALELTVFGGRWILALVNIGVLSLNLTYNIKLLLRENMIMKRLLILFIAGFITLSPVTATATPSSGDGNCNESCRKKEREDATHNDNCRACRQCPNGKCGAVYEPTTDDEPPGQFILPADVVEKLREAGLVGPGDTIDWKDVDNYIKGVRVERP
jgi:hypothetical protein